MLNPIRYFMAAVMVLAALFFYFAAVRGGIWPWMLVGAVVLLAIMYVFTPQFNWWYWQRYAPDLRPGLRAMLEQRSGYYGRLSPPRQREFRRRVFLYAEAQEFIGQGIEDIPEDIKVMVAASAVMVGFGQPEFRNPKFEHVVLYPHPFPSPQYEQLHISELHADDGVVIFSMPYLARSFLDEQAFVPIGLYEHAKIYQLTYPRQHYPALDWPQLEAVSGFSRAAVEQFIGLSDLDLAALSITFFLVFPERLRLLAPEVYEQLVEHLRQDPLKLSVIELE